MKKSGKRLAALAASLVMTAAFALTSWAGTWIYDGPENWKWWYQEDDGTWPAGSWKMIDGFWYHFDANGYLDVGTRQIDGKWYTLMNTNDGDVGKMLASGTWDYGYIGEDGSYLSYRVGQMLNYGTGEYGDVYVWSTNADGEETGKVVPEWYAEIFNGVAAQSAPRQIDSNTYGIPSVTNTYELPENWEEICPRPFIQALLYYACGSRDFYHMYYNLVFQWDITDNTLTVSTYLE